jgi:hypothetical protein
MIARNCKGKNDRRLEIFVLFGLCTVEIVLEKEGGKWLVMVQL